MPSANARRRAAHVLDRLLVQAGRMTESGRPISAEMRAEIDRLTRLTGTVETPPVDPAEERDAEKADLVAAILGAKMSERDLEAAVRGE